MRTNMNSIVMHLDTFYSNVFEFDEFNIKFFNPQWEGCEKIDSIFPLSDDHKKRLLEGSMFLINLFVGYHESLECSITECPDKLMNDKEDDGDYDSDTIHGVMFHNAPDVNFTKENYIADANVFLNYFNQYLNNERYSLFIESEQEDDENESFIFYRNDLISEITEYIKLIMQSKSLHKVDVTGKHLVTRHNNIANPEPDTLYVICKGESRQMLNDTIESINIEFSKNLQLV